MFSFFEMEIDMVSRRMVGFFVASLAGSIPATVFANIVAPVPDRPEVGIPREHPAEAVVFALFEHREIRVAATEVASSVAASATREARPASNRARHLKLRPLIKPLVTAAELRHALPYGLLDALIVVESGYRPLAISRAGAAGLAQLMPATARNLGVANRFDIASSIDGGARYLRAQLDRFESVALALAAYNAGPGAVSHARGIPQNGETPDYVSKVLAAWSALAGAPA
jgi:soluble lytic murein transglycosylase-like protein